jgi:DNA-binding MarR family transcriptional regulator
MEDELSDAKLLVLSALGSAEKEALTMGELAKETGITPSHLSRIMRDLEFNLQYVARERGEKDLRSVTVKLTPAGRNALKAYQAARLSYYQEIIDRCSDKEIKLLDRAINVFEAKVDDVLKSFDTASKEEGSES